MSKITDQTTPVALVLIMLFTAMMLTLPQGVYGADSNIEDRQPPFGSEMNGGTIAQGTVAADDCSP